MATSGTATFNETITQIVDGALRKIGKLGQDQSTNGAGTIYTNATLALNSLIKSWQAMGLHVWTEEEGIVFPEPGQFVYNLGLDASGTQSTDNSCGYLDYVAGQTAAASALGSHTITVASAVGLANGQTIGVLLATGAMQWTTINGAPAGNVVTLTAALAAAVAAGAVVIAYATANKLIRPLKIPKARLITFQGQLPQEIPMLVLSRQEYMDLPSKLSPGTPTQFFYAPKTPQGLLYIWPVPVMAIYGIRFTWYRPLYDVTAANQNVDFPVEWIQPLIWALAEEIGPEFGVNPQRWAQIVQKAQQSRDMAEGWDRESEPIQFGMDWDGME